jgi:hypothetical protein
MTKLKLDLEELEVESFPTERGEEEPGTVHGYWETDGGATCWYTCQGATCEGGNTCWDSCDAGCGTYYCTPYSCGLTCYDPFHGSDRY